MVHCALKAFNPISFASKLYAKYPVPRDHEKQSAEANDKVFSSQDMGTKSNVRSRLNVLTGLHSCSVNEAKTEVYSTALEITKLVGRSHVRVVFWFESRLNVAYPCAFFELVEFDLPRC